MTLVGIKLFNLECGIFLDGAIKHFLDFNIDVVFEYLGHELNTTNDQKR